MYESRDSTQRMASVWTYRRNNDRKKTLQPSMGHFPRRTDIDVRICKQMSPTSYFFKSCC